MEALLSNKLKDFKSTNERTCYSSKSVPSEGKKISILHVTTS
jgi:hypothetical protein